MSEKHKINKDYWQSLSSDEKQLLVDACGTNKAYMSQIANGFRVASAELANKIHVFTEGAWDRAIINPVFKDPLIDGVNGNDNLINGASFYDER